MFLKKKDNNYNYFKMTLVYINSVLNWLIRVEREG